VRLLLFSLSALGALAAWPATFLRLAREGWEATGGARSSSGHGASFALVRFFSALTSVLLGPLDHTLLLLGTLCGFAAWRETLLPLPTSRAVDLPA